MDILAVYVYVFCVFNVYYRVTLDVPKLSVIFYSILLPGGSTVRTGLASFFLYILFYIPHPTHNITLPLFLSISLSLFFSSPALLNKKKKNLFLFFSYSTHCFCSALSRWHEHEPVYPAGVYLNLVSNAPLNYMPKNPYKICTLPLSMHAFINSFYFLSHPISLFTVYTN